MLKIKTTPNLYGVTLMGDYEDLDKLYDSISRYLEFYHDSHEKLLPYHEYEYLLSLNYDIRHCYQGDRGSEIVDNHSGKRGNLYYTVEILYPLIFHYLITFDMLLEEDPSEEWLEAEREYGGKWKESYTMIDAVRDRGQLLQLTGLFWQNLQELLGNEKANAIYDYYTCVGFPTPTSMYCDALIHCQIVNFEAMSDEEKLDYHLASAYEIIDVDDMMISTGDFETSRDHYRQAIAKLNKDGKMIFPIKEEFYRKLDEIYDVAKPFYRNDYETFLNDTYGQDPDPFETGEFQW